MPMLKPGTIWPTPEEEAMIQAGIASDPDNPEWSEDDFARARPAREVLPPALYAAFTDKSKPATITLVTDEEDRGRQAARRSGRPKSNAPKQQLNIRLSPQVVAAFKATGKGWQTRIDRVLLEAVEAGRV